MKLHKIIGKTSKKSRPGDVSEDIGKHHFRSIKRYSLKIFGNLQEKTRDSHQQNRKSYEEF